MSMKKVSFTIEKERVNPMRKVRIFFQMCMVFVLMLMSVNGSAMQVAAAPEKEESSENSILGSIGSLVNGVADSLTAPDVLTIYITGIDKKGDIDTKGLSDVNIIVTVNRKTKEILLVSTPRDYFVPLSISNGVRDKLTHAGNYGTDVCVETMEMLYDIDIDYYLRFNFTGFTEIIDALGGITVHSDYTFDIGDYHYEEGDNEMNGKMALRFARERKTFTDGDRQRGRDQMYVIQGVLKKLADFDFLAHYDELLDAVKDYYETDMPYKTMIQLGLAEYGHIDEYDITSYSVDGTSAREVPYSMRQSVYVMIPDESTVEEAKARMAKVRGEETEQETEEIEETK